MRDVNIGKEVIIVYMMIKAVSVSFLRKIQKVRQKSCLLPRISPSLVIALSCQRGLCNSMKLWAMWCRAVRDRWVIVKSSDIVHWRRIWQPTSVFLLQEPREQYEKAKRYDTGRWSHHVRKCTICYWRRAEGNY